MHDANDTVTLASQSIPRVSLVRVSRVTRITLRPHLGMHLGSHVTESLASELLLRLGCIWHKARVVTRMYMYNAFGADRAGRGPPTRFEGVKVSSCKCANIR